MMSAERMSSGADNRRQRFIVCMYSLLATFSLGLFGVAHLVTTGGDAFLGYVELSGGCLFLVNALLSGRPRFVTLTKNGFLGLLLIYEIVMLTSSGTAGTGVFWLFVMPVAAFFLDGKQRGVWWMLALLTAGGVVWQLGEHNVIHAAYNATTLRQLFVSVAVVATGMYVYQDARERLTSESIESNRQLQSEKVLADMIVEHIREGIIAADTAGNVTFMNPAAEHLLGWHEDELMGKQFIQMVPMLDQAGAVVSEENRPLYHSLHAGVPLTMTASYRRKDGQAVPCSITSVPVTVGGKIVGSIGTFRSVSEEQNIARAKSEFVTLASHQLRTPISAIAWVSELLINGDAGKLTAEQLEQIQDIYRSNRRMGALVNEMLIVSSLELDALPVLPQKTDLQKLAHSLVREQLDLNKVKRHVIEHYTAPLPALDCDPDVIKLLLRNLLSNALKYTPPDGKVELTIGVDTNAKLHTGSKGSVAIIVADTGYGIPEAATSRIFTKFFRAPNAVKLETDGTGLGLYIVKSLLDYVGGRVTFDSAEGKGTTFTVLLPLEGMAKHEVHAQSVGGETRRGVLGTAEAPYV